MPTVSDRGRDPGAAARAEQMQLTPGLTKVEMAAAQEWLGAQDTGSSSMAGRRVTRSAPRNGK